MSVQMFGSCVNGVVSNDCTRRIMLFYFICYSDKTTGYEYLSNEECCSKNSGTNHYAHSKNKIFQYVTSTTDA
jgi:hypothetical protein